MSKNLEHLLRVAKSIPKDEFDMTTYWCGTKGCLLGWCAHDKYFQGQGLDLVHDVCNQHYDIVFEEKRSYYKKIGKELFGLCGDGSENLFSGDLNKGATKQDMIRKIEHEIAMQDMLDGSTLSDDSSTERIVSRNSANGTVAV